MKSMKTFFMKSEKKVDKRKNPTINLFEGRKKRKVLSDFFQVV